MEFAIGEASVPVADAGRLCQVAHRIQEGKPIKFRPYTAQRDHDPSFTHLSVQAALMHSLATRMKEELDHVRGRTAGDEPLDDDEMD